MKIKEISPIFEKVNVSRVSQGYFDRMCLSANLKAILKYYKKRSPSVTTIHKHIDRKSYNIDSFIKPYGLTTTHIRSWKDAAIVLNYYKYPLLLSIKIRSSEYHNYLGTDIDWKKNKIQMIDPAPRVYRILAGTIGIANKLTTGEYEGVIDASILSKGWYDKDLVLNHMRRNMICVHPIDISKSPPSKKWLDENLPGHDNED